METKTIKCSNVKEKEGQYGPSLQIGYKNGEEWENYFANDTALFGYFKKGERVTIEYEKKGNWNIIKGVTQAASGGNGKGNGGQPDDAARQESIQKQSTLNACAVLLAGKDITAVEFAAFAATVYAEYHANPLDALKQKAQETLDAEDDDDSIPF